MLGQIAAFEVRYQLRNPVFLIGCAIFFLLTFGSVTIDQVQIGSRGNVFVNAPAAILQTLAIMSLFAVFVMVALVANAVVRDDETGFAPLVHTSAVSKPAYLIGRFIGAVAACFLVLATIPLAILIGSQMPWLDPEKVGPLHIQHYLYALFVFGLPTLLVVSGLLFALATLTRSMMASYVGAVAFIVLYVVVRNLVRRPEYDAWTSLLDPFAFGTLTLATKYWTAAERNTQLPAIAGPFLANRALWTGVALVLFATAYRLFRFEYAGGGRAKAAPAAPEPRPVQQDARLLPSARGGARTRLAQMLAVARFDMAFVLRSPAFFVLLGIGALNSLGGLWDAGEVYGGDVHPVTTLMITTLQGAFSLIPIIVAVYYGGELVWRDRQEKMHEIVGATPVPDWARLAPKVLAITLVLAATLVVSIAVAMGVQTFKGHTSYQLGHYLVWYLLPGTVNALLYAVLSVFVQVLVPQKMLGWGVMLIQIVASIALATAGFEHILYSYAGGPNVPLSDMNATGRFWIANAWFLGYWGIFAGMLCVVAYALWPHGPSDTLRARLRWAPARLPLAARAACAALLAGWLGIGGFIYYNTNVLNEYRTQPDLDERIAFAERDLIQFENVPQPRIAHVALDVEIFPEEPRVHTRGSYRIENRSGAALPEVHVMWSPALRLDAIDVPGATLAEDFPRYHYRRYRFAQPLAPGEARELHFETTLEEKGFPNSRPLTRVVANGTFVDDREIAPWFGISRDDALKDRAKRHKYGLPRELRPPKLEDESARAWNVLRHDSDWVTADITVTTDADQTPLAPGAIVSDTFEGGRHRVRFQAATPINHFFSIQSARYTYQRRQLGATELSVYYDAAHPYNVERMLDAMQRSLEMFGQRFSPFQFPYARIIEFPGYETFAQSFAGTIPYSESIGFIFDHAKHPEKIDMVTYVTAHEIAHQWWGHQLVPSPQQGATMLVESLAQYSALLVMEDLYGRDQVRRFLKYELDAYLRSRGGDPIEELPLARVEDQPYIHYRKATLALFWLREAIGEDTVDRALRRLLAEFAFKPAPYANTLDFLRILREEAGPQHEALIHDLFEAITLYDVSVTRAERKPLGGGRFEVSLDVQARKLYADGRGQETEAALDEPFEIGVFARSPDDAEFSAKDVLRFERRPLHSGTQTFSFEVSGDPAWVGADPYNKRIDRDSDDNLFALER